MRTHGLVPASAILLIVGAVLGFTLQDTIVKILTERYSIPFIVWARYGIQMLAILLWLLPRMGTALFRTRRPKLHVVRAMFLLVSSLLFIGALKYLPLAETVAITYSAPVLVVILAVIFLGERMTGPRIVLVVAGIAGMLLIVRPGSEIFRGAAAFALGSAVAAALFQIMTRKLAGEDSRVMLFYQALVGLLALTAALPWFAVEVMMSWRDVALIILMGLFGTAGHFAFILAFQRAPASGLTAYMYMHLVWATLSGWIVFGAFPDAWTLAGMAVIAGSGLLIAMREQRRVKGATEEPAAVD